MKATFRALTGEEIEGLLSRNHVGRIAYSWHDRVEIEPLHYVYDDGWLYGRTSEGDKTLQLSHNKWVAFEVDEIIDDFNWQSVVVHGSFWMIVPDNPQSEELERTAMNLISRAFPLSFTNHDPVSSRNTLFRIAVSEVTGRRATHSFQSSR